MKSLSSLVLAGTLLLAPSVACAQVTRPADAHNPTALDAHERNQCRLASRIVATGRPAPHQVWALDFIRGCGEEGARAVASGIAQSASSTDEASLLALSSLAGELRHPAVLAAALDVATATRATTPARAYALRAALGVLEPTQVFRTLDDLTPPDVRPGLPGLCAGEEVAHRGTQLAPIDAATRAAAAQAFARLEVDAEAPALVSKIARCARQRLR